MQKFIRVNKLPYEVVWDLNVLGCQTKRMSKAFSKDQKQKTLATGKKPHKGQGRPGEYEYDCTFCHDAQGAPGELRQHYAQVHYRKEQHRVQMHKTGDTYYCAVIGCDKKCKTTITMAKHYADTRIHQVDVMLDVGLPVWFYRKNDKRMVSDTLDWLLEMGYVQQKDQKKPATDDEDWEEESGEDDIF